MSGGGRREGRNYLLNKYFNAEAVLLPIRYSKWKTLELSAKYVNVKSEERSGSASPGYACGENRNFIFCKLKLT